MEHPNTPEWGAETAASSPFDLKVLLLYGVFRSKFWVAALAVLGLIGGLIFGAAQPNVYQAIGLLQYTGGMQEALTEEVLLGLTPDNQRLSVPGIQDEIITLDNPSLFAERAQKYGPEYLLAVEDPTRHDNDQTPLPVKIMHRVQSFLQKREAAAPRSSELNTAWLAKELRANTKIVPKTATYIEVSYRADTPSKARQICSDLMQDFVARHREIYGVEARVEEQREKVQEAFEAVKKAETERRLYRVGCGIYNYDAEEEKIRLDLSKNAEELSLKENTLAQAKKRLEKYQEKLAAMRPTIEVRTEPVMREHSQRVEIRRKIYELNAEETLANAEAVPAERDSRLAKIRRQREALEASIAQYPEEEVHEPARVESLFNEFYWDNDAKVTEFEAERDALIESITYLKDERIRLVERRDLIEKCREDHFFHGEEVEQSRRAYNNQTAALDTVVKLGIREESGSSNLKITQEPTEPLTKVGPNRWKPLAAGIFGGLALGVALAVLRQLLERRVRYPEVVEKNLGLRVFGVVPETRRLRTFPKSNPAA